MTPDMRRISSLISDGPVDASAVLLASSLPHRRAALAVAALVATGAASLTNGLLARVEKTREERIAELSQQILTYTTSITANSSLRDELEANRAARAADRQAPAALRQEFREMGLTVSEAQTSVTRYLELASAEDLRDAQRIADLGERIAHREDLRSAAQAELDALVVQ